MTQQEDDRWALPLRGMQVTAVRQTSDPSQCVVTLAGGTELTFNGPAELTLGPAAAPGAVPLAAEQWEKLVGSIVVSAVAFKSGGLRAVFNSGHHLNVRGDDAKGPNWRQLQGN
ncbi:DUF6188 family protein [Streptomyces sp. NBC_00443]|uniref:DUF6188 family protein n=1 Tax=Streptomyces sp. NBC_00443 TaxID=2975743 RepID=UPI002E24826E